MSNTRTTLLHSTNTNSAVEERLIVRKFQTEVRTLQEENNKLKLIVNKYEGFPDVQEQIQALTSKIKKLEIENSGHLEIIQDLSSKLEQVTEEKEATSKKYLDVHSKWLEEFQKNTWHSTRFKEACQRYRNLHDQFITLRKKRKYSLS